MTPTPKSSNDFARAAIAAGQLADKLKPADDDLNFAPRSLMVYHLRSAAKIGRELAEAIARREQRQEGGAK